MPDSSDAPVLAEVTKSSGDPEQIRSLTRSVYLTLRGRILDGTLRPLQQLKVVDLVEELRVNSSAIREALSRLAAEHLAEAREQRGFRVAALSVEEFDDITRTRIDIETMMLGRSIRNGAGDPLWAKRIQAARDALLAYAADRAHPSEQVHNEFQDALLGACDSPSLIRIRAELSVLSQRYYSLARHNGPDWQADSTHGEIAEAALAGDPERAQAVLARQLALTADIVREAVARQLS